MRARTVICAYTSAEGKWAGRYAQTHPQEEVKILSPTQEAREVLKNHGLSDKDYFEHPYLDKNFYASASQTLMWKAKRILAAVKSEIDKVMIDRLPLLEAMSIYIETELTNIFFAEHYFEFIEKSWKPTTYYISHAQAAPRLSGWSPEHFSPAQLGTRFFLPKNKVRYFDVSGSYSFSIKELQKTFHRIHLLFEQNKYLPFNMLLRLLASIRSPRGTDILVYSSGASFSYIEEVLFHLKQKYSLAVVVGKQLPQHEWHLRKTHIPFIPLQTHITKADQIKSEVIAHQVERQFEDSLEKWLKSGSKELDSTMQRAFCEILTMLVKKYLLTIVQQTVLSEKVVSIYKPRLVVTTHDPAPSALPFVYAAKAKKITSLVLLHGWNDTALGSDHKSDHIIVFGSYVARWFVRVLKKRSNSVHTAGFSHLDLFYRKKLAFWLANEPIRQTSKKMNIGILLTVYTPNTYPLTLFLEQLFSEAKRRQFRGVFLIRPRLDQLAPEVEKIATQYGVKAEVSSIKNLTEFVHKCDLVISFDTTAIYWPMIMGKPLFYTTPLWGRGITPVKEFGAGWTPKSAKELFDTMEKLQKNPFLLKPIHKGQRKFLRDVVGFYDGNAAKRTFDAIEQILTHLK